jgi:hypothetical protein
MVTNSVRWIVHSPDPRVLTFLHSVTIASTVTSEGVLIDSPFPMFASICQLPSSTVSGSAGFANSEIGSLSAGFETSHSWWASGNAKKSLSLAKSPVLIASGNVKRSVALAKSPVLIASGHLPTSVTIVASMLFETQSLFGIMEGWTLPPSGESIALEEPGLSAWVIAGGATAGLITIVGCMVCVVLLRRRGRWDGSDGISGSCVPETVLETDTDVLTLPLFATVPELHAIFRIDDSFMQAGGE